MTKISILITAFKEPSVAKLLDTIFDPNFNNFSQDIIVYLSAPDNETRQIAENTASNWNRLSNLVFLSDLGQGKPSALNFAFQQIDSDWIICTDGDVYLETNAIFELINSINFATSEVGAISGRPKSSDSKSSFWGYIGNLLADVAHQKRYNLSIKGESYFASGYLVAYKKNLLVPLDPNTLIDDAQFSSQILNQGMKIGYEPKAIVRIKYPNSLSDWIKQKRRSAGGYRELKKDFPKLSKSKNRSFFGELKYVLFPFVYATNFVELVYSCLLFPLRLYLWIVIWYDSFVGTKNLWVRVDSTK
jgi:poly-beta-1,6-N-acetyl-D-glucosamine synthase